MDFIRHKFLYAIFLTPINKEMCRKCQLMSMIYIVIQRLFYLKYIYDYFWVFKGVLHIGFQIVSKSIQFCKCIHKILIIKLNV
jgi:hypothetical protein